MIMHSRYPEDVSSWKVTLPTVGDSSRALTLVAISAECGYEKFAMTLSVRTWQQIVKGGRIVIKRLVPVEDAIVPCEWHFNRYQRGNLFVDWGSGDLRFWIRMEDTEIRWGQLQLSWPADYPDADQTVPVKILLGQLWDRCWQKLAFWWGGAGRTR